MNRESIGHTLSYLVDAKNDNHQTMKYRSGLQNVIESLEGRQYMLTLITEGHSYSEIEQNAEVDREMKK